jgi:hypothetical protein
VKEDLSKDVTVRQVPFMLILSPRWQSSRISEALEMVRFVPPSSPLGFSSETTVKCQKGISVLGCEDIPPIISTIPVNMIVFCPV